MIADIVNWMLVVVGVGICAAAITTGMTLIAEGPAAARLFGFVIGAAALWFLPRIEFSDKTILEKHEWVCTSQQTECSQYTRVKVAGDQ